MGDNDHKPNEKQKQTGNETTNKKHTYKNNWSLCEGEKGKYFGSNWNPKENETHMCLYLHSS